MPRILTSWKEIANYVGKGVRTAQRWETELGMPVRRPVEGNRHVVIAIQEELDLWIRSVCVSRTDLTSQIETLRDVVKSLESENKELREQLQQYKTGKSSLPKLLKRQVL